MANYTRVSRVFTPLALVVAKNSHHYDVTWMSYVVIITDNSVVCSAVYFGLWQIKHHYWPFVSGIYWWLVDSPHKGTVMLKVFPYHDVIMSHTFLMHSLNRSNWEIPFDTKCPAVMMTSWITSQYYKSQFESIFEVVSHLERGKYKYEQILWCVEREHRGLGSLLLTWIDLHPSMDK